jgi:L-lactate dehydrogenase (cytochrome)
MEDVRALVDAPGKMERSMAEGNWLQRSRLRRVFNYEDARRYARWVLPRSVFDYVDGGAEDEVTLRRNIAAFRELGFKPRTAVWVPDPELSTTLFGETISMPILTAPCGGMRLVHPDGDIGVARAAAAAGTIHVTTSGSGFSLEDIAEGSPTAKWFQLYSLHGRAGMENLVSRVIHRADIYTAIVVTVDTSVLGKREKDLRNGPRDSMRLNARNALKLGPQLAARPLWFRRYACDGMPRSLANTAGMTRDGVPLLLSEMATGRVSQSPTWEDIAWVRANWRGPLVVKGVLTSDDARRAIDLGCEGIVVSNHGGRQLESSPATIDVLPEIVAAVGDSAQVLLDSGVRRGGDVLKAIALGAKAVLIGRPYVWGLALGGQAGVEHMVEILRSEMIRTMRLMGCESIHDLDSSWLTRMGSAYPTAAAPWRIESEVDSRPSRPPLTDERLNR